MPVYSPRTGEVFIRNFDQGVVERLGGFVSTEPNHPTCPGRKGYWVDLAATEPSRVPIIFNNPEQIYEKKIYPSFLVTRESVAPAMQRWHSVKQLQYVQGVEGTEQTVNLQSVSSMPPNYVSGFGQIESRPQAYPYDLFYSIYAYARYEHEAIGMVKQLLRQFPPYSRISVIDSLGDVRRYTTFTEGDVSDIGEFTDVADRSKSYTMQIRVEGELDLLDPTVRSTMIDFQTTLGPL